MIRRRIESYGNRLLGEPAPDFGMPKRQGSNVDSVRFECNSYVKPQIIWNHFASFTGRVMSKFREQRLSLIPLAPSYADRHHIHVLRSSFIQGEYCSILPAVIPFLIHK